MSLSWTATVVWMSKVGSKLCRFVTGQHQALKEREGWHVF